MSADLVPRVPSTRFTRNVRVGAVVWALLLAAFWVWVWGILEATADGPSSPLPLTLLAALAGGGLLGWPAATLWRWAGQPRLTNEQQRALQWGLEGAERRALNRALRRGDPPPDGLEEWALPYGRAQHQLVPVGCVVLYMAATNLPAVVTAPGPAVITGIQAGAAAVSAVAGVAMLARARRAASTTGRWSAEAVAAPTRATGSAG